MSSPGELFRAVLAHQGDSADPELLHWIKETLDNIFGAGPWAVVVILFLVVCAIPTLVIGFYMYQRRHEMDSEPKRPRDKVR